jgi:peptidoglycan/xylan/chitin deacetylase (PgdA/CDA1 family)
MKQTHIILFLVTLLSTSILPFATSAPRADIPALCYHQVEPSTNNKFSLELSQFKQQLQYLKSRNFQSLNSKELLEILENPDQEKKNRVLITFDDGYKTVYDYAYPAMKELGFKGILCIYPAFIGSGKAMSWEQLKELIAEGWSVECHSQTHANLSSKYMNPESENSFLEKEIVKSKAIIENHLKNEVLFMVWPYGVYTDRCLALTQKAGYKGAMTVDGGGNYPGIDKFFIKRQVVYRNDSMEKFLIRLGMQGIKVTDMYPQPGSVIDSLASFTCVLPGLIDYSPENYKITVRPNTGKSTFDFDPITKTINGQMKSKVKSGNYFMDVYVRDKRTGVTYQNGWLFSIKGNINKSSY